VLNSSSVAKTYTSSFKMVKQRPSKIKPFHLIFHEREKDKNSRKVFSSEKKKKARWR
jgi:hypothetical protein